MNRLINTIFCVALVAAGALTAHAVSPHELPCSYCTRTVAELASQGPGAAQTAWGRIQSGSAEWKAGNKSAPILEFLDHIGATHELLSSSGQNHPGVTAELGLRNVMARQNGCLYLTENCHFDRGVLSNLTYKWERGGGGVLSNCWLYLTEKCHFDGIVFLLN